MSKKLIKNCIYSNISTLNHELDSSATRSSLPLSSTGLSSTSAENARDILVMLLSLENVINDVMVLFSAISMTH